MRPPSVFTGDRFGRLVVVEEADYRRGSRGYLCRCDCGQMTLVASQNLRSGQVRSCGCLRRKTTSQRNRESKRKHGHAAREARSSTYETWLSMRGRCLSPGHREYGRYGARGITICSRWDSFANFLADMGERPEGKSIDRIDPDGNYEPGNCRWATPLEQRHNRRDSRRQAA
jgi:hypothetical protein